MTNTNVRRKDGRLWTVEELQEIEDNEDPGGTNRANEASQRKRLGR